MLFLRAQLLAGVTHGFTVREGGVSAGPWASLNLSDSVGDDPAAVQENLRRLQDEADLERPIATARQVHGDRILAARGSGLVEVLPPSEPAQDASSEVAAKGEPGDGVLALEPGAAAGVRVADCVPILLYDPDNGVAAAVHSGWRGTRLGIAARAVRALQHAAGSDPSRIVAAIGPSIGACCYEVSPELGAIFRALFGAAAVVEGPKPHLDLRAAIALSLRAAGLAQDRIEQVGGCTSCDAGAYFSHRRDQGRTGRHLAFISV